MQPKIVFVVVLSTMIPLGQCAATRPGGSTTPSLPTEPAKAARYILQNSAWAAVATISTQDAIKNYPFVALKSMSDGPAENSTGVPYFYMTDMDVTAKDIATDNRASLLASLAQSDYCEQNHRDPQNPQCPKLMLTGRILKLEKNTPEYEFGKNSLFTKHPEMRHWPSDHGFFVAKFNVEHIEVFYKFGGIQNVSLQDYLDSNSA